MKELERTMFGNPILRKKAKPVKVGSIKAVHFQNLIKDMKFTLRKKKLGVGLAAPQVGKSIALAVVSIRPTKLRPKVNEFELVIINPKITNKSNSKKELWEGCISAGSYGKADLFAKVPRYESVELEYYDENGIKQKAEYTGLAAQVIQHEVDHLKGVLFVDRVEDTKTFMSYEEYMKRIKKSKEQV